MRFYSLASNLLRFFPVFAILAGGEGLCQVAPEGGFVRMEAGEFMMGNAFEDEGNPDELPRHPVTTAAFQIAESPVTLALWREVREWGLQNGYSDLPEGLAQGEEHPVSGISWYDAVKWCNARSEMEGRSPLYYADTGHSEVYRRGIADLGNGHVDWISCGYRLPLEAEWERAARGGLEGQRYFTGDEITQDQANLCLNGDYAHPAERLPYTNPVGYYAASEGGLREIAGNLWEWCWDRYAADYYLSEDAGLQPKGPDEGLCRVIRGASWDSPAYSARLSAREADIPSAAYYGFRPVLNEAGGLPVIIRQPQSVNAALNESVSFSVELADPNDQTLRFQWYKDGEAIDGAEAFILHVSRVGPASAGNYSVDISNAYGTISSATIELVVSQYTADNLIHYSLNPDPMNSKGILSYLPKLAIIGSTLTFSYTALAEDVDYTVQKSTDLVEWTDVASDNGKAILNLADADRQFVRLKTEAAASDEEVVYACTKPEGYVTLTIPAGPSTTYFGMPLESPAVYRFNVGSVTSDTMTFADAAFAPNQFTESGPYWLRVISGAQAGRYMLIESNTENSLTLDLKDDTPVAVTLNETDWAIQEGDIVEIAPADTLKSFFENIITPATNPRRAERVSLWNGTRWVTYYNLNESGWYCSDGNTPLEEDIVLRPHEAWAISTNRAEETTILLKGSVPEQPVLLRHPGNGANVVTANRFPIDVTLGDFRFGGPASWTAGNPRTADTVGLWTGARWVSNYLDGNNQWKLTTQASDDQSATPIASGAAVNVLVRQNKSGAGQFFSLPLPYNNPRE